MGHYSPRDSGTTFGTFKDDLSRCSNVQYPNLKIGIPRAEIMEEILIPSCISQATVDKDILSSSQGGFGQNLGNDSSFLAGQFSRFFWRQGIVDGVLGEVLPDNVGIDRNKPIQRKPSFVV